jgi:hypothetical protein
MRGSPEYKIWSGIRTRCLNPRTKDYIRYGGRGISICDRWSDFAAFFEDVGPRPSNKHSIERLNTNGDYDPDNVVWATAQEQARNRRNSTFVLFEGTNQLTVAVAERFGVCRDTIVNWSEIGKNGIEKIHAS